MKLNKVIKKFFNLTLLVFLLIPVVVLTTSCQKQNYQIKSINLEVAKILGLYDKTGKSLIKQIIYNNVNDEGKITVKSDFGISTNYCDSLFLTQHNLFANINFNILLKPENISNVDVINFIVNDLKISNYHDVDFSRFKFKIISYQPIFNKNKSNFWVEPTIATIAIVQSFSNQDNIICQQLVNVAEGEIPITKKSTFNLLAHDLLYTAVFSQPNVPLTAKTFNNSVKWNINISVEGQADQKIAEMLKVKIIFKISSSDKDITGVVKDEELLKSNVCYYIALFIGNKFTWANYLINYR